ncbi:MAG TPA: hypothetical protein VJ850_06875 [Candidatus Limnocylindrales bacterium]|nr:hypothetical protein [Candidatus Limnocylindrales bacterium]
MLRIAIVLILFAHGIGHSMGLLQLFKLAVINPAWKGDSWLLAGTAAPMIAVLGVVIWSAAIIGFSAAAAILLGWLPATCWVSVAVGAALVSLVGLFLFPTAFPTTSSIGAFVVNSAVLVAVLWGGFGPAQFAET